MYWWLDIHSNNGLSCILCVTQRPSKWRLPVGRHHYLAGCVAAAMAAVKFCAGRGSGGGALVVLDFFPTCVGVSTTASNLHHVLCTSQLATFLNSNQQGPLIFRSNKNLSSDDWFAPKTFENVSPFNSVGRAGNFEGYNTWKNSKTLCSGFFHSTGIPRNL